MNCKNIVSYVKENIRKIIAPVLTYPVQTTDSELMFE